MPQGPDIGTLDPANQFLAEALSKSFRILKLVMLVLVVLYFLSGLFAVKPNEVGLKLRYGRVVGAGDNSANPVLQPGWHWSWPYPFERWVTVPTSERELPIEFMFMLTDEERTGGISGYRYESLSPMRDDFLITGDVNILHASLVVKYRVTDAVAYLTNVLPMPAPRATVRSPEYQRYPEYTVLRALARNAAIETAARREALDIRGTGQSAFLVAVATCLSDKLKNLEKQGQSLGISVDPESGVIAPKAGGTVEAILPPRQVQEVFDRVFAAQSEKSAGITKARAEAQQRLLETAGQDHERIAAAVDEEFELMLRLSQEEGRATAADAETVARLRSELEEKRRVVEAMLKSASGEVQAVLTSAQIARDQIVKEASGDYEQFQRLLPEYARHPEIFMSRFRDETYADALANPKVAKMFIPEPPRGSGGRIWLQIPRSSAPMPEEAGNAKSSAPQRGRDRDLGKGDVVRSRPTIVGP